MAGLYRLNDEERRLFQIAKERRNPSILTNYYLRTETSGTWVLPGAQTKGWRQIYERLFELWKTLGKPDDFENNGKKYRVEWAHEKMELFPEFPAFFHNHGFLFLDYQKQLYLDRHPIRTVIGGFGSGKTLGEVASMLIHAITLPEFRGFGLAPLSLQAEEIAKLAMELIVGTLYEERFLIKNVEKPYPKLTIGHEEVGKNTIECYPILGAERKLRTLTGDSAIVDQAERLEDLGEILRSVGTRFRGRTRAHARPRLGTITFLANADDNPELWEMYDKADDDPKHYFSMMPSTYDNIWLTDADIVRFEAQVGNTKEQKDIYLRGFRPTGGGDHFSHNVLVNIVDENLDKAMERGLNREINIEDEEKKTYICKILGNIGAVEWLLPYEEDHIYLVISDPGTKNPPYRDSPPIMVWDITNFPGPDKEHLIPARLVGFVWVYGNGSIDPWATRYSELVYTYKAVGRNGFDATGFQSGYDQWMMVLNQLLADKINLAGSGKFLNLNSAKVMSSRAMVKIPKAVKSVVDQLSRYKYPEPENLRQDVAVCFFMSCWWMMRLFYFDQEPDVPREDNSQDRYYREATDRYENHIR